MLLLLFLTKNNSCVLDLRKMQTMSTAPFKSHLKIKVACFVYDLVVPFLIFFFVSKSQLRKKKPLLKRNVKLFCFAYLAWWGASRGISFTILLPLSRIFVALSFSGLYIWRGKHEYSYFNLALVEFLGVFPAFLSFHSFPSALSPGPAKTFPARFNTSFGIEKISLARIEAYLPGEPSRGWGCHESFFFNNDSGTPFSRI